MISKFKHCIWVFFTRIRINKELKKLKTFLAHLEWAITVEKNNEPTLIKKYQEVKLAIFMNETLLKGLQC